MNKEVTGCLDCPLSNMPDMHPGYRCVLKLKNKNGKWLYIEEAEDGMPITPNWCPLKKEPITISIKL